MVCFDFLQWVGALTPQKIPSGGAAARWGRSCRLLKPEVQTRPTILFLSTSRRRASRHAAAADWYSLAGSLALRCLKQLHPQHEQCLLKPVLSLRVLPRFLWHIRGAPPTPWPFRGPLPRMHLPCWPLWLPAKQCAGFVCCRAPQSREACACIWSRRNEIRDFEGNTTRCLAFFVNGEHLASQRCDSNLHLLVFPLECPDHVRVMGLLHLLPHLHDLHQELGIADRTLRYVHEHLSHADARVENCEQHRAWCGAPPAASGIPARTHIIFLGEFIPKDWFCATWWSPRQQSPHP